MQIATGHLESRIGTVLSVEPELHRWIGRCKACKHTAKIEGQIARCTAGAAVVAPEGTYSTRIIGEATHVLKACGCNVGGRTWYVALRMVMAGTKGSKHTCGARCTSSTGPNCDCRCRGANHGKDC